MLIILTLIKNRYFTRRSCKAQKSQHCRPKCHEGGPKLQKADVEKGRSDLGPKWKKAEVTGTPLM